MDIRWIIVIFIVIYILLDIYAFQAVKTLTNKSWVYCIYWGLSFAALAANFYYHFSPTESQGFSVAKSYAIGFLPVLFIPKLVLVIFLFGEDLIRVVVGGVGKLSHSGGDFSIPSRRKFLSKLALGVAAIPFASLLYGMYKGKYSYKVLKHTLYFDDLPDAFNGYRFTHISDIHSGSFSNHENVQYGVDLIKEQKSDAVFFTGDLVNFKAEEMDSWKGMFGKIDAKDGVFSILGNHDYGDYVNWESEEVKKANFQALKKVHADMGWKLLLNEHRFIERDGQKIAVVGVENWGSGFAKHGDSEKASQGLKMEDFKILLSHDPSHWKEKIQIDPKNYQLTLSGHTHGMQFGIEIPGWFKWSPIQYRYAYWAGLYKEFGRVINVNRGFGYLAYPGRVGIKPEITVVELRKDPEPL